MKTLKDFEPKTITDTFISESLNDKRESMGYYLACKDLREEAIKQIKFVSHLEDGWHIPSDKERRINKAIPWMGKFFGVSEEDLK